VASPKTFGYTLSLFLEGNIKHQREQWPQKRLQILVRVQKSRRYVVSW